MAVFAALTLSSVLKMSLPRSVTPAGMLIGNVSPVVGLHVPAETWTTSLLSTCVRA